MDSVNDKRKRLEELTAQLSEAARIYYGEDNEVMSNKEYDELYDELELLERELGIVLAGSPTAKVGYEAVSSLPKERHPSPMLSLDKTKETSSLREWLGDKEALLSWKLDGLTIVLTYEDGKLEKAVTRGDGTTGEVITNNAKVFDNIPLIIPYRDRLVVRGEAVIGYDDFQRINDTIEDVDAKYKNPRNLCSGTVRQLNNEITAKRHVKFFAFSLAQGGEECEYRHEQMEWLASQGFDTVEYVKVDSDSVEKAVRDFEERIEALGIPSDGLVLVFDDIKYGESLGATAKFPRDSIAFKWRDEVKATRLKEILWNVSRTGLINPIAVFEPVELEGTTVSRASVHNLSIVKELQLGTGDEICVYKANMIIPQIAENLTKSGTAEPPRECPVCGAKTELKNDNGVETLHCPNPQCPAKRIKLFTHIVSRNALNIDGLSEATLERFVDEAIIREPADIFRIYEKKDRIVALEGFGEKSFENLTAAVEKARNTTPERLLFALGIPNIGVANAKMIAKECQNNWEKIQKLTADELSAIDGIGDIMAESYVNFFRSEEGGRLAESLLKELNVDETFEEAAGTALSGKAFVITGKLKHFENRDMAKAAIEQAGGRTAGSVSSKTDYLVNNDITSNSGKNKKAKELGIPVITEDELIAMINTGS